jgi:hypothetical protein
VGSICFVYADRRGQIQGYRQSNRQKFDPSSNPETVPGKTLQGNRYSDEVDCRDDHWQTIQSFNYQSPDTNLSVKFSKALERIGLSRKQAPATAHSILMDSFIDAILNGGEPIVSAESARSSVELINALILSAMRKKVVDLPIDPAEYDCLIQELSDGTTRMPVLRPL